MGKRKYYDCTKQFYPDCMPCEHCDGERSDMVREDTTRGRVCPLCDSSLNEMYPKVSMTEEV